MLGRRRLAGETYVAWLQRTGRLARRILLQLGFKRLLDWYASLYHSCAGHAARLPSQLALQHAGLLLR